VSLRDKEGGFHLWTAAEPAQSPACSDNAVKRQAAFRRGATDIADGACGARASARRRDVAIRRDVSGRNSAQRVQHAAHERARLW
jgi:hypothetical protein